MALQALAEYAILSYAGGVNLTVSLASTNLDYQETFELHRANQKVLHTAVVSVTRAGGRGQLPARPCVSAGGSWCLLSPDPQPPHRAICECQG